MCARCKHDTADGVQLSFLVGCYCRLHTQSQGSSRVVQIREVRRRVDLGVLKYAAERGD